MCDSTIILFKTTILRKYIPYVCGINFNIKLIKPSVDLTISIFINKYSPRTVPPSTSTTVQL